MSRRNPDERVVKPGGKTTTQMIRSREMHLSSGEWGLARLAGEELRRAATPKPSQWSRDNRRP